MTDMTAAIDQPTHGNGPRSDAADTDPAAVVAVTPAIGPVPPLFVRSDRQRRRHPRKPRRTN